MFFTTSCLHYSCIYTIRNAIAMCKYVVYHPDEFSDPIPAFILGVLVSISTVLCEVTNLASTLQQKSVIKIVSKFVSFKLLV